MTDDDVVAAVQAGDEATFGRLVGRYQRELQLHCYRMLGSFEESQDLTQETYLRAWTGRQGFRGEAPVRAWLYRIATNACLDFLAKHPRTPLKPNPSAPPVAVPWLQPYPDDLLDGIATSDPAPDAQIVSKETVELAFLAAIQYLRPKERAVLLLRDVLGWSAKQSAELLDVTVAAVNSALQRARLTIRTQLPDKRADWTKHSSAEERAILDRYMTAIERIDENEIAALLREDALVGHQAKAGGNFEAHAVWYSGRDTILEAWAPIFHGKDAQELRLLPTRANRQPAIGTYIRPPGSHDPFVPFALDVLRIEDGKVVEVLAYGTELFAAFGLPETVN